MADISQDEIDALFKSADDEGTKNVQTMSETLTDSDKDVLGEVGNISMGAAATTLSSILGEKVVITAPVVHNKDYIVDLLKSDEKLVSVDIKYKAGLQGSFLLILKESDVKNIAGIMMGAGGESDTGISEMELSAISEAMNQMIGTSCTSMSQVFKETVDISPPVSEQISDPSTTQIAGIDLTNDNIVVVEFELKIGEKINSKMMQIMYVEVAKQLIGKLTTPVEEPKSAVVREEPAILEEERNVRAATAPASAAPPVHSANVSSSSNAQKIEFQDIAQGALSGETEKIALIQDVPLLVVVELGRTHKSIKEILEFGPGVVIELDKMAGEPIDILINDKFIAKGEVVVIDENFGIRITEIVDMKKKV